MSAVRKARPQVRFRDPGTKFNYSGDMLVTCPRCGGAGRLKPTNSSTESRLALAFTCPRCSQRVKPHENGPAVRIGGGEGGARSGNACDPYLGLPLHLQVRTRHGVLFAYNEEHLDMIEAFVAAGLRERRQDEFGWRKSSMARLPLWVKAAKNRAEVLRALGRLRSRLADADA